jgi:CobQ-like glutamine amidotransferase family enzyme
VHLYPEQMNMYGDWGNVLAIRRRAEWFGYAPEVVAHHPGRPFPTGADIVIGGGGQDSGQHKVHADLMAIRDDLRSLAEVNAPMLMVCGLYQLFGHFFETSEGDRLEGIGLFDAETHGGPERLIGNVVTDTPFGELIGYENHSGLTILGAGQTALGRVIKGSGNNGQDRTEGAVYRSVYGTYLHGSLLPKNPRFADALLEAAALYRHGSFHSTPIDDQFAEQARLVAKKRPR